MKCQKGLKCWVKVQVTKNDGKNEIFLEMFLYQQHAKNDDNF